MKLKIKKSILENIVSNMQPFLEKKDQSNITSHLYFEINNSKLEVRATDYEMGLKVEFEGIEEFENGKATVNGVNFLNILRRLKDTDLTLETLGNDIVIKQNKSNFKLHMYEANEYPAFIDVLNMSKLDINRNSLINSFKK